MMLINPYTNAASFNCQPIQTSQLIFGTGTSNQFEVPFYGLRVYGESANILPQTTIGSKKQIYRVGWFFSGFTVPPTYTFNNVQIWMAHTTNGEFPSNVSVGYSTMSIKDLTKVYEGSWSVSANNQWILVEVIGAGDIGFTWDGSVLTTNLPKPPDPEPVV